MKSPYKIAIVQQAPVFLNIKKSIALAVSYIAKSASKKARMVVFPETWLPGYPVWLDYAPEAGLWDHLPAKQIYKLLVNNSIEIGDVYFKSLINAAVNHNCLVVMGANERVGRTLYNTMFYFKADGSFDLHRKLIPTYTERLIWGMGDGSTLPTINDEGVKVTGLICWEHWMPLARAATHANGEHIHIAQWPMVKELHQIASRQYAFEGQCFVIAAGGIITKQQMLDGISSHDSSLEEVRAFINSIPLQNDEFVLNGGSCVFKPDTNYLIQPYVDEECIIFADLELESLPEGNLTIDTNGHYARPDVFQLHVNTTPQQSIIYKESFED